MAKTVTSVKITTVSAVRDEAGVIIDYFIEWEVYDQAGIKIGRLQRDASKLTFLKATTLNSLVQVLDNIATEVLQGVYP